MNKGKYFDNFFISPGSVWSFNIFINKGSHFPWIYGIEVWMFQNFLYILNLAPHPAGAPRQNKNNHHSLFLTCPDTWPHFTVSSIHSSHIVSGDELFVNWWLVSWLVFVGFCCFFLMKLFQKCSESCNFRHCFLADFILVVFTATI